MPSKWKKEGLFYFILFYFLLSLLFLFPRLFFIATTLIISFLFFEGTTLIISIIINLSLKLINHIFKKIKLINHSYNKLRGVDCRPNLILTTLTTNSCLTFLH